MLYFFNKYYIKYRVKSVLLDSDFISTQTFEGIYGKVYKNIITSQNVL